MQYLLSRKYREVLDKTKEFLLKIKKETRDSDMRYILQKALDEM